MDADVEMRFFNVSEVILMNVSLAVIIATKDRSGEIKRHALTSLERSTCRDFLCVVWDASQDEETRRVVEDGAWTFPLKYFRAPRAGSASQRNDAVKQVLMHERSIRYVLFIDDDCELSQDALKGILTTFEKTGASVVNLPMHSHLEHGPYGLSSWVKKRLGWDHHGATEFLYNYGAWEEKRGGGADWASGGGMALDVDVFRKYKCFFPEDFQRFGGYALGEDFAFSFFLHKKMGMRIVNSLEGHFFHYPAGGARLNLANMAASKWYNFHLLFECIYDDVHSPKLLWLKVKFKLFMLAAALKLLFRARSLDLFSLLRGIGSARAALREFHATRSIKTLIRRIDGAEED